MLNCREKIGEGKEERERALGTHETLTKGLTFMTLEAWGRGREGEVKKVLKEKKNGG